MRKRLTSIEWCELQADYERGASIASLARKSGASREAIYSHIKKDSWVRGGCAAGSVSIKKIVERKILMRGLVSREILECASLERISVTLADIAIELSRRGKLAEEVAA